MAGDITTQPKQGRQAAPMSSLCILLCLWVTLLVDCPFFVRKSSILPGGFTNSIFQGNSIVGEFIVTGKLTLWELRSHKTFIRILNKARPICGNIDASLRIRPKRAAEASKGCSRLSKFIRISTKI